VPRPAVTATTHVLPFEALEPLNFERLCLWLVRARGFLRPEHYGLAGSEQGRDVVAYLQTDTGEELWYFQCKRRKEVSVGELTQEIDKIRELSRQHPDLEPKCLVFITSCGVSAKIRDDVRAYGAARSLTCEFWARTELDLYVQEHPTLLQEFFAVQRSAPFVEWRNPSPATLERARETLASMPTGFIPSLASLPPGSRMPYGPNPLFTGHEKDTLKIATMLAGGETTVIAPTVAATGLGGIGKTQLASEFVHRYGQFFSGGVFWINFATPDAVETEVAQCGGPTHLDLEPGFEQLPLPAQVDLVLAAWDSPLPRLLVFDNCEDEALLTRWKRPTGGARIIVTSRRAEWSPTLGVGLCPLGVLQRDESITLLQRYLEPDSAQAATLGAIADALGDLPLALHLAGSFLLRYGGVVSPAAYLQELSREDLLSHPSLQGRGQHPESSPTLHEQHVARTFAISLDRLDRNDPTDAIALKLLARAACLAPNTPIDPSFLAASMELDDEDESQLQMADAVHRLVELGLIERVESGFLRLHGLLAVFAHDAIADPTAQSEVEEVFWSSTNGLNWAEIALPLLPMQVHLRFVAENAMRRGDQQAARLAVALGRHLFLAGDYRGSEKYFEWAVPVLEELGEEGRLANALNFLGVLHRNLGNLDAARRCYEQAMRRFESLPGAADVAKASVLNNFGLLLQEEEEYAEAMRRYSEALELARKTADDDPLLLATTLHNIGLLLHNQGKLDEAEPYYLEALQLRTEHLGDDHWRTATTLNNLGGIHSGRQDHERAKDHYTRALAVQQVVLGRRHPEVALTLGNIGSMLAKQDDHRGAVRYLSESADIYSHALGPSHSLTLAMRGALCDALVEAGDFVDAEAQLQLLIDDLKQASDPDQDRLAHCSLQLGELAMAAGFAERAEQLYRDGLDGLRGNETQSPVEALLCTQLALLLKERGESGEILPLLERALHVGEHVYGKDNAAFATQAQMIANYLLEQNRPVAAKPYLERALKVHEAMDALPEDYGFLAMQLGSIYQAEGRLLPARTMYVKALEFAEDQGSDDESLIRALNSIAVMQRQMGYYRSARPLLERAWQLAEKALDPGHEFVALTLSNFASLLFYERDYANAAALAVRGLNLYEKVHGPDHPSTQLVRASLETVHRRLPDGTRMEDLTLDESVLSRDLRALRDLAESYRLRVDRALAAAPAEERESLAAELQSAATHHLHGQVRGSPYFDFAEQLREWASMLSR
jgi:tetratricopeptide (TPR) repeat protein